MLGSSCPTTFLGSSDESGKAFLESAGTTKSKKQAAKRLSQARSADKVGLAEQGDFDHVGKDQAEEGGEGQGNQGPGRHRFH